MPPSPDGDIQSVKRENYFDKDELNMTPGLVSLTLLLAIKMLGENAIAHTMWLDVSDYSPSIDGNWAKTIRPVLLKTGQPIF